MFPFAPVKSRNKFSVLHLERTLTEFTCNIKILFPDGTFYCPWEPDLTSICRPFKSLLDFAPSRRTTNLAYPPLLMPNPKNHLRFIRIVTFAFCYSTLFLSQNAKADTQKRPFVEGYQFSIFLLSSADAMAKNWCQYSGEGYTLDHYTFAGLSVKTHRCSARGSSVLQVFRRPSIWSTIVSLGSGLSRL